MEISTYIKSRRKKLGLTQKQLAQKVNLTDVTISRYETKQREPSWSDFLSICKVLGMNPNDFINERKRKNYMNKVGVDNE